LAHERLDAHHSALRLALECLAHLAAGHGTIAPPSISERMMLAEGRDFLVVVHVPSQRHAGEPSAGFAGCFLWVVFHSSSDRPFNVVLMDNGVFLSIQSCMSAIPSPFVDDHVPLPAAPGRAWERRATRAKPRHAAPDRGAP
jgi:hypothetical protein